MGQAIVVNLRVAYLACHHAVKRVKNALNPGGLIVLVTSVQGSATQERVAAYTTSKGGMLALTRATAVDHAKEMVSARTQ